MPSSSATRLQSFRASLRRMLLGLCALMLALQLVGSAFHDHDLDEQLSDCVSCQMASHAIADIPAVAPQLLALFLAVAYLLARLPRPLPHVVLRRYLIPPCLAPPRPFRLA